VERPRIAVIRGDGIGPELAGAALRVLEAVGDADALAFDYTEVSVRAARDVFRRRYTPTAERDRRAPSDRFTREPAPATDRVTLRR
jgi:isocitrate/isopropylmalate dehydrogenase